MARQRVCFAAVTAIALILAGTVEGQDFWNPPTLANRNASGFEYYMLEVPPGASMIADGHDTDWSWFDPEYVVTMVEWRDEGERPLPTRDDLDVTTKMAWKGAPDNRWYVFMHVHDDTLGNGGATPARWNGDMIGIQIDYQDHGRTRGNSPCYGQEWIAAAGNVTSNFRYRYPESEGGLGQPSWAAYGQAPWLHSAVRVDPAEAWAADAWTSDTGGDTYYEWNVAVVELLDDAGPAASVPADLDAISGLDGRGLPFNFFVEDGDPGFNSDMTLRGAEASARQYFAHALLLRVGEYTLHDGGGGPPAAPVWSLGIGVINSRGVRVDVELGLAGGGSDGLDSGLGERALPPVPPASAFDVRWRLPSGEGSEVDYRGMASPGPAVTWTLAIQSSSRALPVTVSWDPTQLPVAGVYRLQDVETGGEVVNVDLRHQSSYQVTSVGLTELQVVYELVTQTYDLPAGWSLVSLPCALPDARLSAIFPQAISLYRYRGRYELVTAFEPGVGYWVNLPSATQVMVLGPAYPDSAVAAALPEEWSLVGLGERTLDVAGLKVVYPSLVSVFGYLSGYFSATAMTPGAAYWVNLSALTQLDLSGAVAAAGAGKPVLAGLPAWTGPTLWAEGPGGSQAIALGAPAAAIVALPPVPPASAFDVRVAMGSGVEACQVPAGGGAYRVRWQGGVDRLRWDLSGTSGWEVEVDGVVVPLAGQGELQVTASSAAWLRPGAVLPSATVLHPCYPNPFNPTTTMRYELAQAGEVSLRVYGVTGQKVRELVSARQDAGAYQIVWDGRDAAGALAGNGVYLCELRAGRCRAVQRLVLMK